MGDTLLVEKGSVLMENIEEVKRKSKGKESRFGKRYGFEFKLRCVKLRLEEGLPFGLLCKEVGVSKGSLGRWVRDYQERGEAGLRNQGVLAGSRRKLPGPVREKIVEIKKREPFFVNSGDTSLIFLDILRFLPYTLAMARLARVIAPGYPHHVTQRGVRSLPIFRNDEDRKMYLEFMARETKRFGVKILAWCLMSNHVHLIAVPQDSGGLALGIGEAHKRYSRMRNFEEGVRGYLFQGRFGSCVLDEKHLVAAVRYVERNPVRAGIVRVAWEYSWSSAAYHVGQRARDVLVEEPGLWGYSGNWKEYIRDGREDEELVIRRATRTGRPWMEGPRLSKLEKIIGRDLQKRRPGRPLRNAQNK